jgi:hypothetical protein
MWRRITLSGMVLAGCISGGASAQMNVVPATKSIEAVPAAQSEFPDIPPLPKGRASLIGGTVRKVDPIRDRISLQAFGGGDFNIDFDVRTRVMRGSAPAELRDVHTGTRLYADTIQKDGRVFAKTLHLETSGPILGETRGQVLSYDPGRGLLKVRDIVSEQPLNLRLMPRTEIRAGDQAIRPTELVTGALVHINFQGVSDGPSVAEKIDVMAKPGSTFVFTGRIAVIDLRDSHLTLSEQSGENTFEVGLHSLPASDKLLLTQGTDVVVRAEFDGRKYEAKSIEPVSTSHH